MIIELKTGLATAKIATLGAELISFIDSEKCEYMWQKDPKYWAKCSPVLFPIIGNLKNGEIKFGGVTYAVPKHGFASVFEFSVVKQSESSVSLNLKYDDETLKLYPCKFSLTLEYTLVNDHLTIDYTVENLGMDTMHYCLGAHPAFNIPSEQFSDYCLEFDKNEDGGCTVYDVDRLEFDVDRRTNPTNNTNKLQLNYDDFISDVIVFDPVKSSSVVLKNAKTNHGIKFDFNGFNALGFWTPIQKEAPFLCIEPWKGMAYRKGEDDNFENKHDACVLLADEKQTFSVGIQPSK